MRNETNPFPAFPEAAVASAQHGLACICRAWTQVALGMMAAGTAELNVARSMYVGRPAEWRPMLHPDSAQAVARHWLHDASARYNAAVQAQRQANTEFVHALFNATETMIEGLPGATYEADADLAAERGGDTVARSPKSRQVS